jgi:hypothetical protein
MIYSELEPDKRSNWIKNGGGKDGAMRLARLDHRLQVNLWDARSKTYYGCWWTTVAGGMRDTVLGSLGVQTTKRMTNRF